MKSFIIVFTFAIVIAQILATPITPEEHTDTMSFDEIERMKKSVYGGASHGGYAAPAPALHPGPATSYSYASHAPTVPCAKNILVSCSPSVAPVPCAAPAYGHSSYGHESVGSAGAYSEYYPRYMVPAY